MNCGRGALRVPPLEVLEKPSFWGALGVIFGVKSPDWRSCLGEPLAGPPPEHSFSKGRVSTAPEQCHSARLPSPEGKGPERTAMSPVIAANSACGPLCKNPLHSGPGTEGAEGHPGAAWPAPPAQGREGNPQPQEGKASSQKPDPPSFQAEHNPQMLGQFQSPLRWTLTGAGRC